ncbi:hypothetical protein [Thiobacillus sp.]
MQAAHSNNDTPNQWWRWALMPFASIAGAVTGAVLLSSFMWFGMKMQGGFSEDGWYYQYILPVLSTGIFGYLYVYIACSVAPRGKVIVGTVMVTLLGCFSLLGLILLWTLVNKPSVEVIRGTVSIIAGLISAIAALVVVHSDNKTI